MHQRRHIFIIIRYLLSDSYRRIVFMVIHLIILGDRKTSLVKMTDRKEDESSLFIFSYSEYSSMDLYRVTCPAVCEKEPRATLSDLEEACNLYLQERFVKCISIER